MSMLSLCVYYNLYGCTCEAHLLTSNLFYPSYVDIFFIALVDISGMRLIKGQLDGMTRSLACLRQTYADPT